MRFTKVVLQVMKAGPRGRRQNSSYSNELPNWPLSIILPATLQAPGRSSVHAYQRKYCRVWGALIEASWLQVDGSWPLQTSRPFCLWGKEGEQGSREGRRQQRVRMTCLHQRLHLFQQRFSASVPHEIMAVIAPASLWGCEAPGRGSARGSHLLGTLYAGSALFLEP